MGENRVDRRLAAIFAGDIAGYSRLMGADEEGTLRQLKAHRKELVDPKIGEHRGRIVKTTGDGVLVEFVSAVDAVQCAVEIQRGMSERNADLPAERRIEFRIGVNVGDIIGDAGDIFGDGVNVAARLEGMAEPGSVLIPHWVRDSMGEQLGPVKFFDNGERKFKNIARPIRVWSWPRKLPSTRAEGKPRVFIAPFEGRTEHDLQIAKDLADELQAHLSRLTGLEVGVERGKAHYVVAGGVHIGPNRSRTYARLVDVESDRQIWSDRYDENTDDPFEIVDRCVPRIAMCIRRRVAADDAERLASRPLDELSLEELLAVAGVSFFTPTKTGWQHGGEIAEQALQLAPHNFMALAMAAAGLGVAEELYGFRKTEEAARDLAFKRIEEALRLTNRSDMLHAAHSLLLLYGRTRLSDAAAAARRGLELNPDYNMCLWCLGAAQVFAGENDACVASATRAVNIDIRDPYVHLYSRIVAYGNLGAGRYDESIEWFQKADHLAPGLPPNLMGLAVGRWLGGDKEGAATSIRRLVEEEPTFRVAEAHQLPYREPGRWMQFAAALRQAGAPE